MCKALIEEIHNKFYDHGIVIGRFTPYTSPSTWRVVFSHLDDKLDPWYHIVSTNGTFVCNYIANKEIAQQAIDYAQSIEVLFV